MARSNFIRPDLVRLAIGDDDWIEVKRRLTAGEERRVFARVIKTMHAGERAELDPEQVGVTRIAEYVVEWGGPGFSDGTGRAVPYSTAALDHLDPDVYRAIERAVEAHEARERAARDAEKNERDGASSSTPISPSVA